MPQGDSLCRCRTSVVGWKAKCIYHLSVLQGLRNEIYEAGKKGEERNCDFPSLRVNLLPCYTPENKENSLNLFFIHVLQSERLKEEKWLKVGFCVLLEKHFALPYTKCMHGYFRASASGGYWLTLSGLGNVARSNLVSTWWGVLQETSDCRLTGKWKNIWEEGSGKLLWHCCWENYVNRVHEITTQELSWMQKSLHDSKQQIHTGLYYWPNRGPQIPSPSCL